MLGILFLSLFTIASVPSNLPADLRLRVDKTPNQLQGDFNNDGRLDVLQVVAVDRTPRRPVLVQPLHSWSPPLRPPISMAFYIRHGGSNQQFLLHSRDYLDTPIWKQPQLSISLVRKGSPVHRRWQRILPRLRGDAVILPTEASIDTLLYWNGSNYTVGYDPDEIP